MSTVPDTVMDLTAFCARINVKRSYGTQLKKEGRLVLTPDGKGVLVEASIARIEATRDPSKAGVAARHAAERGATADTGHQGDPEEPDDTPSPDPAQYSYQSSKAKREHWAAEREHAAYRKEAGELIERSVHVAAFAALGATVRAKLEAWAAILPPQLVGRDESAIGALIADQVAQVLAEISAAALKQEQPE